MEQRKNFSPQRYLESNSGFANVSQAESSDRSCLEAWFLGSHINIGGCARKDGLSLWPLQWILGEAEKFGLVLGFDRTPLLNGDITVRNPIDYTRPRGDLQADLTLKFGVTVRVWGLGPSLGNSGLGGAFEPDIQIVGSYIPLVGNAERTVFGSDGRLIGYDLAGKFCTTLH